ncbi:MAG: acyl carrier protein [Flavobacteriales bacterium]|nr:acyl carrier protein [Flavobacteriales bacterium]
MTTDELIQKLSTEIINELNLAEIGIDTIDPDELLFGEGLGLDSIDSLELMALLERNYGIKINDPKEGRKVLQSVRTMAEFIESHQKS